MYRKPPAFDVHLQLRRVYLSTHHDSHVLEYQCPLHSPQLQGTIITCHEQLISSEIIRDDQGSGSPDRMTDSGHLQYIILTASISAEQKRQSLFL
ncbi:hypothetical protein TNCT_499681 [Trichonephila clavata]|uniref:Uncharacterized protein n=1 Tax=Trichonephila clavata TaxID=2740835 RepID=A0A8X6GRR9_TRICU|nr:hypothetical protein TNCT_67021 [Trichonephila clavata]GFR09793.1 hypothetical protein TNCT_499681 [Trichonephila clavata]